MPLRNSGRRNSTAVEPRYQQVFPAAPPAGRSVSAHLPFQMFQSLLTLQVFFMQAAVKSSHGYEQHKNSRGLRLSRTLTREFHGFFKKKTNKHHKVTISLYDPHKPTNSAVKRSKVPSPFHIKKNNNLKSFQKVKIEASSAVRAVQSRSPGEPQSQAS